MSGTPSRPAPRRERTTHARARSRTVRPGSGWVVVLVAVIGWSLWSTGALSSDLLSTRGLTVAGRFAAGALRPETSAAYLTEVLAGAAVTASYALLGTVGAVLLGVLLAPLASRRWWQPRGRAAWGATRSVLAVPRGVHEAVWGLLLVILLGPEPLVGVLAIAVPYGAITTKVYADLLDAAPQGPYDTLRAAGAGRLAATWYGLVPLIAGSMVSYALYRLDCAIRAAAILGIVGVGGLGLLLDNAFQDLSYGRMWTCIYALMVLCAVADLVSRRLRRGLAGDLRLPARSGLLGGAAVLAACLAAAGFLGLSAAPLWSGRVAAEARYLADVAWPPTLPTGGWPGLGAATLETFHMSVVALAVAGALAVVLAPLAAELPGQRGVPAALGRGYRFVLLLTRAVPSPVWALVLLFVLPPGPLPGALALAVYNLGVLGRLAGEVVEDLPPGPHDLVRSSGAGRLVAFAYGTLPLAWPRLVAYTLYRWEVAARETVVVGLVSGGGLGYVLARQLAAFDLSGAALTVVVLIVLTAVIDLIGAAGRRAAG